MDWVTVITTGAVAIVSAALGGIIGARGALAVSKVDNAAADTRARDERTAALALSREERVDNRHKDAYIEILTAAHAVDRLCRTFAKSGKTMADTQAFADALPRTELQRARIFTKFGSREVSDLMDAVIDRVAGISPVSRGSDAEREYDALLTAVYALDAQIASEMTPEHGRS